MYLDFPSAKATPPSRRHSNFARYARLPFVLATRFFGDDRIVDTVDRRRAKRDVWSKANFVISNHSDFIGARSDLGTDSIFLHVRRMNVRFANQNTV